MLTIEKLIKDKKDILKPAEKQKEVKEKLHIKSLDDDIEIVSTDEDFVRECIDRADDKVSAEERLIYYCVSNPSLKSEELLKAYDCSDDPFGIVKKVFKKKETIRAIANEIINISGVDLSSGVTRVLDNIKN
ncbi:hypothetical protein [Clostridium beijerinckii]|uniref:hypothetical protein n=1 Tax=Clostridium beijerinckii TaxID=1520 RepID=UPI00098C8CFC|nr:hypothetical protein [Clostridium beijerinckii]NOW03234.1 hypothetical protein [Clostridium beijerinckii]NRT78116.1 hypothetical protein [Clostridium beijerinckii]NYC03624.1 hypothetical protein [Clostridium beijerinckii]OOM44804.1 phage XkdN-like protein [Clostridium beijerinckii]